MNSEELTKLMQASAQDAVDFAKQEFDTELDYSFESLRHVDSLILACIPFLKGDEEEQNKTIFTVCNIFGAYAGEVFKRYLGGDWVYDTTDEDAPTTMLAFQGRTYAFAGICYQRLINDQTVSLYKYFELAQKNSTQ